MPSASRKRESEADYIGLYVMAKAGYDIRKAPDFWGRMQLATEEGAKNRKTQHEEIPTLLRTHPFVSAFVPNVVYRSNMVIGPNTQKSNRELAAGDNQTHGLDSTSRDIGRYQLMITTYV